jgi:uncharacterized protein (TIGR03118 family)
MKISRLALIVLPVLGLVACSSSSNETKPVDASDTRFDTGPADHEGTDGATDAATDAPGDVAADAAPTDGGADASDASADVAADGARPPHLTQTLLVVDQAPDGGADADAGDAGADAHPMPNVDPGLVNPWGLAINPSGPIWVANNGTGLSTVYDSSGGILPVVVTIPTSSGGTPPSAPTGLVFNPTIGFMNDRFVFSSEDGTIAGWQTGAAAVTRVDNASTMAVYKGLALAIRNNVARLYATDFHNRRVDAFDMSYNKLTTTGNFADPGIPAGFAPFGIMANGSAVYVTFAKQDAMMHDDVAGVGNGYVDVFDFDGVLMKRLVSQGALSSPWGLALAPADFAQLSNTLLVGNFGDGKINAYNPTTGALVGAALDTNGAPMAIPGLWALVFGNDTPGAAHNQLFFTAGPVMETHGQLGRIDFVP